MRAALRRVQSQLLAWIEIAIIPRGVAVNREYRFEIDPYLLQQIPDVIQDMLDREILNSQRPDAPVILQQVTTAYQAATAAAATNIITQSQSVRRNAEQTLMSDPYQRRIQYLSARMFEEMEGFNAQTRTELSRVLSDSIARGDGMREITRRIVERIGVAESRGERIARTEINNAHRRAVWDQDQDANDEGINTRLMWLSALSPTTRYWHASRHGHIYHRDQVEEFYSQGGNAINCKCTTVSVLVDANGNPLSSRLPDKLAKRRKQFVEENYSDAA